MERDMKHMLAVGLLVLAVSSADFLHRATEWDMTSIPVPVDLLVYTDEEWTHMRDRTQYRAVVWVYERSAGNGVR